MEEGGTGPAAATSGAAADGPEEERPPPPALAAVRSQLAGLEALECVRAVSGPRPVPLMARVTLAKEGGGAPVVVGGPSGSDWDWTPGSAVGPPLDPDGERASWELELEIDGPARSAYSHPVTLRLTVDCDFPTSAPAVRFKTIVHHFMLSKHMPHDMLEQYMEAVARRRAGSIRSRRRWTPC